MLDPPTNQKLTPNDRYSRQTLFEPIGNKGQDRLMRSKVLIVGCGALGASHAETLARAGVGHLRLVDRDFVEYTNLQRQTLYKESDAADRLPKAVAAKARLAEINSNIEVDAVIADVNHSNITKLLDGCDLVLDGTDNFQVRYLVNDACVEAGVTWIHGAAVSSYGTTMTVRPGITPCLRCVFDEIPEAGSAPTCDTAGVIMPIISMVSATQVSEALKILVGDLDALHGSLLQFDVWANDRQAIKLGKPDPDCPCCGKRDFEFLDADGQEFSAVLCGRDAVQISPRMPVAIDLQALAAQWSRIGEAKHNEYLARVTTDGKEVTVFADGRAIIKGVDDIPAARALYSRFVGN